MIEFRAALRRISTAMQSMITRGVITRVDDSKPTQVVQIVLRFGETADDVELLQPFGLSFAPPEDTETVVLAAGASQDNVVALASANRRLRPTGADTESGGLYDGDGWKVYLSNDGFVHLGEREAMDFLARADRVDAEIKAIRDAIINAKATPGTDGGGGLQTTMIALLNASPQQPTKSDKVKGT